MEASGSPLVELSNSKASLILNPLQGSQIHELTLTSPSGTRLNVIERFDPSLNFFATGSFLMYPWVNRLSMQEITVEGRTIALNPPVIEPSGQAIHGLIFDRPRKVVESSSSHVVLKLVEPLEDFPEVTEEWRLEDRQFHVRYVFNNVSEFTQQFAFGCHPYFALGTPVDSWIIETNMSHYHPLTSELLPGDEPPKPIQLILDQTRPLGATSLDNTLTNPIGGPPTFSIADPTQHVRLTLACTPATGASSIAMQFLQVYTPPTRRSLAVEPMSAIGNVFVKFPHLLTTLQPGETKEGGFSLALDDYNI